MAEDDDSETVLNALRENPYKYITQANIGRIFGFGTRSMKALVAMPGCPVVAKKLSPAHFHRWLWESRAAIGKLTVGPD